MPTSGLDAVQVLLRAFDLPRKTCVVDVGANPLSEPLYGPLLRSGGCAVVGFEPNSAAYEKLQATKGPDETYLPFAVGDGRRKTLYLNASSGFTSVLKLNKASLRALRSLQWARLVGKEEMQTVAIDRDDRIGRFDLMKIDIQGGEVDVFRGAEKALGSAMAVIVELRYYPLYVDEPMMGGVDVELRRQGFCFHKVIDTASKMLPNSQSARLQARRLRDQAIDGDVVYIRRLETLSGCTDEQLKHLCIIAAGVIASHSLALYVLDILVARKAVDAGLPAAYVDAMPEKLKVGA